jgi:exodeoxyribonuclease V gamma subunit
VSGQLLRTVTYSRVNPRQRLAAWVRLLALTAADPERRYEAVTIGRARSEARNRASVTVARIGPLDPAAALAQLVALVDLYDRGMREPLPIASETSAAYAAAVAEAGMPSAPPGRRGCRPTASPRRTRIPSTGSSSAAS